MKKNISLNLIERGGISLWAINHPSPIIDIGIDVPTNTTFLLKDLDTSILRVIDPHALYDMSEEVIK